MNSILKKRGNLIWTAIFILLLITNFQYLEHLYYRFNYYENSFLQLRNSFFGTFPHLLALLAVDLVGASFYWMRNSSSNWKIIFILLFLFDLIFFIHMLKYTNSPYLPLALFGISPYFVIISAVHFITILFRDRPYEGGKWVYISILVLCLVLFFAGKFVFQFSTFGLLPGR